MEDEKKFNNKAQNTSFAAYNLNLESFFGRQKTVNCNVDSGRRGCCLPPTLRAQNVSIAAYNLKLKTFLEDEKKFRNKAQNTSIATYNLNLETIFGRRKKFHNKGL